MVRLCYTHAMVRLCYRQSIVIIAPYLYLLGNATGRHSYSNNILWSVSVMCNHNVTFTSCEGDDRFCYEGR